MDSNPEQPATSNSRLKLKPAAPVITGWAPGAFGFNRDQPALSGTKIKPDAPAMPGWGPGAFGYGSQTRSEGDLRSELRKSNNERAELYALLRTATEAKEAAEKKNVDLEHTNRELEKRNEFLMLREDVLLAEFRKAKDTLDKIQTLVDDRKSKKARVDDDNLE